MNILIVDDHPVMIEVYEYILSTSTKINYNLTCVSSCEEAHDTLTEKKLTNTFSLAILDYKLPEYSHMNITNGCDIARLVRAYNPKCKIVMVTGQNKILFIYDLLHKIYPEALILKNDLVINHLPQIIESVLDGNHYYSATVKSYTAKMWNENLTLDEDDRTIIFNLQKGHKVKDLPKIINLSASTIQRRIFNIKKIFKVDDDSSLILELTSRGFL
ncbi:response regulator [Flavobacterium sp. Sd200]|uniref:response regulator n=1 Tax=Flavobacterium sp. Sd200 TaxID=2692211 RepID=UPI001371ADED|nr:response regulator [Flavobacterium sp. Sd200]MXN92318.1 response regulator [Flavobacterium sp. Sd200]